MTGSMGLALAVGTGVAMASALPTIVVDGDGSLPGTGTRFAERASGYESVCEATSQSALRTLLTSAVDTPSAVFIHCPVQPDTAPPGTRITPDLPGVATRFSQFVRSR
ncbi:hypothetical protein [Streptomyces sp. NPDC001450]